MKSYSRCGAHDKVVYNSLSQQWNCMWRILSSMKMTTSMFAYLCLSRGTSRTGKGWREGDVSLPVKFSKSFSSKDDRVSSSPSSNVSLSEFWFPRAWLLMDCLPLRTSSSEAGGGGKWSFLFCTFNTLQVICSVTKLTYIIQYKINRVSLFKLSFSAVFDGLKIKPDSDRFSLEKNSHSKKLLKQ